MKAPMLVGIVNLTPDSFSDGGNLSTTDTAVAHAKTLVAGGARMLDLGAESTRPGAQCIGEDEELSRLMPALEAIRIALPEIPLSVDTRKAAVADAALTAGAHTINDVSGLTFDEAMVDVVARHNAYVVIMHSKGTPETMQHEPDYADVVDEVEDFLLLQTQYAQQAGVSPSRIAWDVGFGFGKTVAHNVSLLKTTSRFASHGYPLWVGLSRKSFLAHLNTVPSVAPVGLAHTPEVLSPEQREAATAAAHWVALCGGARVLRVHSPHLHLPVLQLYAALTPGA